MILSGSFILDCRFALLTLIGTVQECDNLRSGAGIPGAEQAAADTAGHAVLLRPCDCISIIGIRCHITERAAATDCGAAGGSIEECDRLLTGAGGVRAEFTIACAGGDTVLHRPRNCLSIIAVRRNIREAAHALGFGRTGSTPQERDDLRTSAGLVGAEMLGVRAGGDAILRSPENCIIVIIAGLDVHEEVQHRVVVHEGRRDRDLGGGHGEGVLAVALVGERKRIAVCIFDFQAAEDIACVGLGVDCHGRALGHEACKKGFRTFYANAPKLLGALKVAKVKGTLEAELKKIERCQLLILDDLFIVPLDAKERPILLEIIEDRHERKSVIITSQYPSSNWYDMVGDPTIADAILDRIIHTAHTIELYGESMRKLKSKKNENF